MGGVLGHVGGGSAVFTTQRQTLQHAQDDEDDGRRDPDAGVVGQDADNKGGTTHQQNRDQEGVFAANHVAQTAEHQRAEGTHDEAGRKGEQREDERGGRIQPTEELLGDDGRQGAVEVEVVPLEHGAERRGEDDLLFLFRHRRCGGLAAGACDRCHGMSPVRNGLRSGSPRNDLTFDEVSDPPLTPN